MTKADNKITKTKMSIYQQAISTTGYNTNHNNGDYDLFFIFFILENKLIKRKKYRKTVLEITIVIIILKITIDFSIN